MLVKYFEPLAFNVKTIARLVSVLAISAAMAAPAHADIKIGFQGPLTGPAAADGKSAETAAQMAVDDINAAGGVLGQKLELVPYDDQAKSDQAIFTANRLVGEDGVKLVVSAGYSASARAAAPIFQKAGVVMLSTYAVHPDVTRAGDYIFRMVHLGSSQGVATALYIGKTLSLKKVSIVSMDNDYGQSTLDGFLGAAGKYGIEVVNKYSYSVKDRQFGSIVASVKRDSPDAVYVTGYFFTGGPLVAQLREAGVTAPIIASQAFDSNKFPEIAGAAAEGTYVIDCFNREGDDAALKNFSEAFTKRADAAVDGGAAYTYSAVKLVVDAIRRANSPDADKVRDALAATKNFETLDGPLAGFNGLREMLKTINVGVIKNGQFKPAGVIDDLSAFAPPEK
jgi:branched-chain amino acid transport system substrate-binding protein